MGKVGKVGKGMLLGMVLLVGAGAAWGQKNVTVTSELKDGQGQSVGTAEISGPAQGHGVTIRLKLHGLPAGEHALHVHQNPVCEAPAFTSAGPHFNPAHKQHGALNPQGAHAGDLPNFTVDAEGNANVSLYNQHLSLGEGGDSVFANGGTALVVHAAPDDLKTDPAGNAGGRIACGVIKK